MTAVTDVDMQLHVLITQNVNNLMFFFRSSVYIKGGSTSSVETRRYDSVDCGKCEAGLAKDDSRLSVV